MPSARQARGVDTDSTQGRKRRTGATLGQRAVLTGRPIFRGGPLPLVSPKPSAPGGPGTSTPTSGRDSRAAHVHTHTACAACMRRRGMATVLVNDSDQGTTRTRAVHEWGARLRHGTTRTYVTRQTTRTYRGGGATRTPIGILTGTRVGIWGFTG